MFAIPAASAHEGEGGNCAAIDTVNARLIQCRHHAHGHHQLRGGEGTEHHTYDWYRYEAVLLRHYLKMAAVARYVQAVQRARSSLVWRWSAVAECESGGNWSINTGNGYYGGLQFLLSTWHSVGGSGYPHQNSAGEQAYRAEILKDRAGLGQWPVCGRNYRG